MHIQAARRRKPWLGLIALFLLVGLTALGLGASRPGYLSAAPGQNLVQGSVFIAGDGAAAGAVVKAFQDGLHAVAPVDASGAYSMTLGTGTWQVTVNPPAPTTTSPTWIYTGTAQAITFSGDPDPNPNRLLNFTVAPASATITGSLITPNGGTDFSAPNRAWVRAENQEGQGNTVQVDPVAGTFSVRVLPGYTFLRMVLENDLWAPPTTLAGSEWLLDDSTTLDAGSFPLVEKQASITGSVTDENGHTVANIPVNAWRFDGSETAMAVSDSGGNYTLHVISGTWELRAVPPADSSFVTGGSFERVVLPTDTSQAVQLLKVATVDATVSGTIVDRNGVPLPNVNGRAYALYQVAGRWVQFGPGARITNGSFTMKLATSMAQDYQLRAYFPPSVGYTAIGTVDVHVIPGDTKSTSIPAAPDNSTIGGHFNRNDNGQPLIGVPGIVYAASNSGGWDRDRLNPLDGSYEMDVATVDTAGSGGSTWWLHAFVDPTTGYAVQRPRTQRIFLPYNNGNGSQATVDFTVAQINARITGLVKDAQDVPYPGVSVSVREQGANAGEAFTRWTLTNAQGRYSIAVPAGTYEVRAAHLNQISPVPQTVTVGVGMTATADLQFRSKDAWITGQVTYNGTGHLAFVRAFSDTGAHAATLAGVNGNYLLRVNSGDTWHVQAVSEDQTTFLKSNLVTVTTHSAINGNVDLALQPSATLPEALVLSFDAGQDQVLTLADGSQLLIPAGAMADTGTVSVVVRPLPELADDGGTRPISFGYRLLAFEANRVPITRFNIPIKIVLPFTADQLTALGVTADQLIPTYWDPATDSWIPVPGFALQLNPDGSGTVQVSLDHFTDYALMSGPKANEVGNYHVYLPLTVSAH